MDVQLNTVRNKQQLIPAELEAEHSFESYLAGDNRELLAELRAVASGEHGEHRRRVLYFWGESGSGKTHLLHACCQAAREVGIPNFYLPMNAPPDQAQLARLEKAAPNSLICVDDFQNANDDWQTALFSTYEKVATTGGFVVAANQPIAALNLTFKDLESRLISGGVLRITGLTDPDKLTALKLRARLMGFELTEPVLQFIITYYHRDTASLFALLDRIDTTSLAEQRKITVPFIRSLL